MGINNRPAPVAQVARRLLLAAMLGLLPVTAAVAADAVIPSLIHAIPLVNNSRYHLDFYLLQGSGWQHLSLAPGAETELPFDQTVLAIGTAKSAADAEALVPPNVDPGQIGFGPDGTAQSGPFFLRRASKGDRFELCWDGGIRRWVVAKSGESLCGPG